MLFEPREFFIGVSVFPGGHTVTGGSEKGFVEFHFTKGGSET